MKNAEMKVIHFGESDVIATSYAKLKIAGVWDGESGNASVSIGSTTYEGNTLSNLGSAFNATYGANAYTNFIFSKDGTTVNHYNSTMSLTVQHEADSDTNGASVWNGTWKFNGSVFTKVTQ